MSAFVFPAMAFALCDLTFLFLYDDCLVLARLPALRVLLMFFSGLFGFFRIELSSCAGCDTTNFNQ